MHRILCLLLIIIESHVKMRSRVVVLSMMLVVVVLSQPACLLDDPLTDACIQSVNVAGVDPKLTDYLCTIAYERKLYGKAEEFCGVAMHSSEEQGYSYFNALLANGKMVNALKNDYTLFFVQPFDHNTKLTASVKEMESLLKDLVVNEEKMGKMNDFDKAILYFYLK